MTIISLYGNIATGKTTLCRSLVAAFPDLVYINDDTLYTMFGMGKYRFGASPETFVLNAMRQMEVGAVAMNGLSVVIDMPLNTDERRSLFEIRGCDHVAIVTGWHIDPAYHAQLRFDTDSRGTSYETWLNVATRLGSTRQEPNALWRTIPAGIVKARLKNKTAGFPLEGVLEGPELGSSCTMGSSGV